MRGDSGGIGVICRNNCCENVASALIIIVKAVHKMEMIALKKPKATTGENVKMGVGLALAIMGVLMLLSIVLFLPGIGAFLVGFLLIRSGRPKEVITCAQCGGDVIAAFGEKQAKCEHCNTVHPIAWSKK